MAPKAKKPAAVAPAALRTRVAKSRARQAAPLKSPLEALVAQPWFYPAALATLGLVVLLLFTAVSQAAASASSESLRAPKLAPQPQSTNAPPVKYVKRAPVSRPKPVQPWNPFAQTAPPPVQAEPPPVQAEPPPVASKPVVKTEGKATLAGRAAAVIAKGFQEGAQDVQETHALPDAEAGEEAATKPVAKRSLEELRAAMGDLSEEDLTGMINAAYRSG